MSFGTFLTRAKNRSGQTVTGLVDVAGISRATYYLLERDEQQPSLLTSHRLLTALGYRARIPDPDSGDKDVDLEFFDEDLRYTLRVNWSEAKRNRSREKFWKSAETGVAASAALGVAAAAFPPWGAVTAAAAAVKAVSTARRRQQAGVTSDDEGVDGAATPDTLQDMAQMVDDLRTEAGSLSSEDLEALLATIRAMREPSD